MHELVAGDDVAGLHGAFVTGKIGHEPTGLAYHQHAGRKIPRRETALPIGVEPAGCDVSEVERSGAKAAQACDLVLDRPHLAAEQREIAASVMRQRAAHDGIGEAPACRHADTAVVEESALAALGREGLV